MRELLRTEVFQEFHPIAGDVESATHNRTTNSENAKLAEGQAGRALTANATAADKLNRYTENRIDKGALLVTGKSTNNASTNNTDS